MNMSEEDRVLYEAAEKKFNVVFDKWRKSYPKFHQRSTSGTYTIMGPSIILFHFFMQGYLTAVKEIDEIDKGPFYLD